MEKENPKRKPSYMAPALIFSLTLFWLLNGCTTAGPSAGLLTAQTNLVEEILTVTNTVEQIVAATTPAGVTTYTTNHSPVIVTVTNTVEKITYTPSQGARIGTAVAGTAIDAFAPGFGQLAQVLIGGILGVFAGMKTKKTKQEKAGAVMVQTLETFREAIKQTPQGAALEAKLSAWMRAEHAKSPAARAIRDMVTDYVSTGDAHQAAEKILSLPAPPAPRRRPRPD